VNERNMDRMQLEARSDLHEADISIENRVLVTGGSGFIGHKVVENLIRFGSQALSLDVISSSLNCHANCIVADVMDLPTIDRILSEYDCGSIIHLVGLPHIGSCHKDPYTSFRLNVLSVQNILEAMRKNDTKKIVFASSAAVYGYSSVVPIKETDIASPNTIYGYHKLIAEETIKSYCNSYGLSFVILRLFNVYGGDPGSGKDVISLIIKAALNGDSFHVNGPKKFRDFVDVDGVAEVFVKAAINNVLNKVVNVGTGKSLTLQEMAEIARTTFPSLTVKYEYTDDDGTGLFADISLVRSLFNFSPRDPREGITSYMLKYRCQKTG
jgi:UDP-glucose 4-epimerase